MVGTALVSIPSLVVNVDILVRREPLGHVGDLLVVVGKLLEGLFHSVVEEGLPLLEPEEVPRRMTSGHVDVSVD